MRVEHDQFSKEVLRLLLRRVAHVEREREVSHQPQRVDLSVMPRAGADPDAAALELGVLALMVAEPALIEVFSAALSPAALYECLRKQLAVAHEEEARGGRPPQLWVLSAGDPREATRRFGLRTRPGFPPGFLFAPEGFRFAVVAIPRLPTGRETLPLRLLGVGPVRERAMEDLVALAADDPMRAALRELVVRRAFLRQLSGSTPQSKEDQMLEEEFQRFTADLEKAALERGELLGLQRGELLGLQRGELLGQRGLVLRVLEARFGGLGDAAKARVDAASEGELTALMLRVATAESLEDVFPQG